MILVRDIPLYSTCEHHLIPFLGKAHVAYIPGDDGRITGLSKLARLVDVYAKRPQVQERLTTQIADTLGRVLRPRGVFVSIEAEHLCMSMRGVRKPGSPTVTQAVRGLFQTNAATRAEVMSLIDRATLIRPAPDDAAPLVLGRQVMGVVNVTPDSFSDGGRYLDPTRPSPTACELVAAGAEVLDVGGRVDPSRGRARHAAEELRRVRARHRGARGRSGVPVGVDTSKAAVAEAALAAGATIVNDVSAGRPTPTCWRWWPRPAPGYVRHAHVGMPADDAGRPPLRRRGRRGAAPTCAGGPAPPRRPGSPRDGCSSTPASGSARRPSATWRSCARLTSRGRVDRLPCWSGLPQDVPGAATAPADRDGGHPGHRGVGPRRRRGDGAGARGRPRPGPPVLAVAGQRQMAAVGAQGTGPGGSPDEEPVGAGHRAPQLHLGHQGPPGRRRTARGLRPQPPQGAAPGGDHLAAPAGLHDHPHAARLASQPPRLRRDGDALHPGRARPVWRRLAPACPRSTGHRPSPRRPRGPKVLLHHEEFGDTVARA